MLTTMFLSLKILVAKLITARPVGMLIRFVSGGVIKRHGCIFTIKSKLVRPEIIASIFFNIYESTEIRFIKKYLRSDLPIIELGTSIGIISSIVRFKNSNSLFCIEANRDLIPIIESNFRLNKIDDFRIMNVAIGYLNNGKLFFVPGRNNTSGRLSDKETDGSIEVKMWTFESIIRECNIGQYILICDIEGAEAQILEYDTASLFQCKQIIIETHEGELNGKKFTPSSLKAKISELGFRLRDEYGPNYVFER
jgi:FkbM family methyltransferase